MEGPDKLNIKTYFDTVMQNILGKYFDMGYAEVKILLFKKKPFHIKPQFKAQFTHTHTQIEKSEFKSTFPRHRILVPKILCC